MFNLDTENYNVLLKDSKGKPSRALYVLMNRKI